MGLLDDAIREHLELKRRRGADPNEIDQLEREALGPVRRAQSEGPDGPAFDEGQATGLYTAEEAAEAWAADDEGSSFADHGAEFSEPEPFEDWDAPERDPMPGRERGPIEAGVPVEPDVAAPATPAPPAPIHPSERGSGDEHLLEQETVEHDVEGEQAEEDPAADDMLEETPEFLQDTPDHDRLWFEQRPPRDFDLDG